MIWKESRSFSTFLGGSEVKNLPANAGDAGDVDTILGLGKSLEKEMATHSSVLAWEIPWMEEPGVLTTVQGVTEE